MKEGQNVCGGSPRYTICSNILIFRYLIKSLINLKLKTIVIFNENLCYVLTITALRVPSNQKCKRPISKFL